MTTALALPNASLAFDPESPEFRATASHMAKEYREGMEAIKKAIDEIGEQSERIYKGFLPALEEEQGHAKYTPSNPFYLSVSSGRERYSDWERIADEFKRSAWRLLVGELGIRNLMSIKQREEYERQLASGELPEIHEDAIIGMIISLGNALPRFCTDAAKEVFEFLRPSRGWGGEYKTNNAFKVGRRVILTWWIAQGYGGCPFKVNYHKDQHALALDSVFHLLDGKGAIREGRGELYEAINASKTGRGETTYFRFKCFKNGNLHLEFRRLDLVKQLNGLATGSFELGRDADEVA